MFGLTPFYLTCLRKEKHVLTCNPNPTGLFNIVYLEKKSKHIGYLGTCRVVVWYIALHGINAMLLIWYKVVFVISFIRFFYGWEMVLHCVVGCSTPNLTESWLGELKKAAFVMLSIVFACILSQSVTCLF